MTTPVGVVFPTLEIGNDPGTIRDFAEQVEALGYSHLLTYDHVLGAQRVDRGGWVGRYDDSDAFYEPFVLFSYLAAATTTLEFATAVLVLPQRQTALVAKQAAVLDVLSGGRLRLGVGIGRSIVESQALGARFADRAKRIEEQIALLRSLWTNEIVTFEGRWHTVDRAGLNPMPVQRPIPIWMGGDADRALARIARLADGWFPRFQPNDAGRTKLARMKEYLAAAGRDPESFPIEGTVEAIGSDAGDWAATAEAFLKMGVSGLHLQLMGAGRTPSQHLAALQEFRRHTSLFE